MERLVDFYEYYESRLIDPGFEVCVYNNYFDAMVDADCIRNPNGDWKYDDEWGQCGSILEIMAITEDYFNPLEKHYKIKYIRSLPRYVFRNF